MVGMSRTLALVGLVLLCWMGPVHSDPLTDLLRGPASGLDVSASEPDENEIVPIMHPRFQQQQQQQQQTIQTHQQQQGMQQQMQQQQVMGQQQPQQLAQQAQPYQTFSMEDDNNRQQRQPMQQQPMTIPQQTNMQMQMQDQNPTAQTQRTPRQTRQTRDAFPRFHSRTAGRASASASTSADASASQTAGGDILSKIGSGLKAGLMSMAPPNQRLRRAARTAQDVEDCVACRFVWLQVEMDIGNSQIEDNIYDSFMANAREAQKAPIFFPAAQDMKDAVDDMIGDYMDGYTVNQMCENARLCR